MAEPTKSLVMTGYSSQIAKDLVQICASRNSELRILRCGRSGEADYQVDFSSHAQTREFIAWLKRTNPDYLFLNHGILPGVRLAGSTDSIIDEAVRTNLVSFAMIIEVLPEFDHLHTVVMSSISGKVGSFDTLYAACKAGVDVALRGIAASLPPNARANAVSPGIIGDARMTLVRKDLDVLDAKRNRTPTKTFTTSREVAGLVYYLLFEGGNIQGENININGGIFIP